MKRTRIIAMALLGLFILSSIGFYGVTISRQHSNVQQVELDNSAIQLNPLYQDASRGFRGSGSITFNNDAPVIAQFSHFFTESQASQRRVRSTQFLAYWQNALSYKAEARYYLNFRSLII